MIPNPEAKPAATLGPFLQAWLAARKGDYKPASLIAWGQVIDALTRFLGADCPLVDVTPAKGEAFRQSMLAADLRATTIHKRLQHARMFFAHAKRQGLVDANPFEYVRHRPGDASERRAYVPAADVLRAIEHAPNGTWKLLIALSRFAGLRVPSEALSLRWQDVDWERGRLTVPSPKTQHLAGRSYRVIPLFPAIRPFLEAAWDEAPEGAEYVMPEEYRRRAPRPGRLGQRQPADHVGKGHPPRRPGTVAPLVAFDAGKLRNGPGPAIPAGGRGEVVGQHPSGGDAALR